MGDSRKRAYPFENDPAEGWKDGKYISASKTRTDFDGGKQSIQRDDPYTKGPRLDDNGNTIRPARVLSREPLQLDPPQDTPLPTIWTQSDGYVYIGYRVKQFRVPPRKYERGPMDFNQTRALDWERPGFPYLAFIPDVASPAFFGSLTNRFCISPRRFPVEEYMARGVMHTKVDNVLVRSWYRCEKNILAVLDILLNSTGYYFVNYPDSFLPDSLRLGVPYPSTDSGRLVKIALDIRNKFVMLFSALSFFVSLRKTWGRYEINNVESNWQQFQGDVIVGGVHPIWAAKMQETMICSTRIRRRGVIIDYGKTNFTFLVPYLLQFNMPVILRMKESRVMSPLDVKLEERIISMTRALGYGFPSQASAAEFVQHRFRRFVPTREYLDAALAHIRRYTGASYAPQDDADGTTADMYSSEIPGSSLDQTTDSETAPVEYTYYPSREEFFARRDKENEEKESRMSTKDLQRVQSRRQHYSKLQEPGRNNKRTKVYMWDWTDDGTREYRTLVAPGDYEMLWDTYKDYEMRYDAVNDEFDCWDSEWQPSMGLRPPMDDEDRQDGLFDFGNADVDDAQENRSA
ncbi:hypothetical protein SCHPADRAFT_948038, partial [Schizopora paradoxa]